MKAPELKSANRTDSWGCAYHLLWRGKCCIHALWKSAWGQSQLKQENRVLVRCALEGKPQKASVMRCYLNVKVRILQIHGCKPVLGANLLYTLSSRREIPGITFQALMNWHSGLVVGCVAITCVGGGRALLWGGASGAVFTDTAEWGGKSYFCENVCIFIEWTTKTQTFEHLNFWRLGAGLLSCSPRRHQLRHLQQFRLENLQHCHGVQRGRRLAIRGLRFISEVGCGPAWLRGKVDVWA